MQILITTRSEHIPGPTIVMHCPLCNANSVPADSYEQIDRLGLFWVIPLLRVRNTFVQCSACGKKSIAKVTTNEIADYSADELSYYLTGYISIVARFLAIASLLLFWAPAIGLVLGISAVLANLRTVGWPRMMSWVGAILSGIVTIGLLVLSVLDACGLLPQ